MRRRYIYVQYCNPSPPTPVTFNIIISAGHESVAVDTGKAWSWGNGLLGTLGNNDTIYKSTPIAV